MTMNSSQKPITLPEPRRVSTPAALKSLTDHLMQAAHVAVDTEANSLYAYREQVCLIQISIPSENYLIDPLALDNLSPLEDFFAAPDIEKVFHAADYDLSVLYRDFGFLCQGLFDTMWAARMLGWDHVGLADILEKYFNVTANKRYQRYNWGKRPLDSEAVHYAMMDTYYLLDLRDIQYQDLKAMGRWEEAQEMFNYLCTNGYHAHQADLTELFWRIKGVYDLDLQEQRVLYQIHLWRERMAEKLDRPPVKVIGNKRMVKLAHAQPKTYAELKGSGILTRRQMRRFGSGILSALRTPVEPLPKPPEHKRPPQDVIGRYKQLKAWRKKKASRRGVDSDVILPNATLWKIAEHPPQTLNDLLNVPGIGPWRKQAYGPDILNIVQW